MEQRIIKFRAWDTFNERMVYEPHRFVPSCGYDKIKDDVRFDAPFQYYEDWRDEEDGIKRPCFIMQFTGLLDKNGKEIYEGDILRHPVNFLDPADMHTFEMFTVVYNNGAFEMSDSEGDRLWDWNEGAEIIGNIYEHPNLLTSNT